LLRHKCKINLIKCIPDPRFGPATRAGRHPHQLYVDLAVV